MASTTDQHQVLASLMDIARDQDDYEFLVTNLLEWINRKIEELNDRNFPNSLEGIKMEMNDFTSYRVKEKPPKWDFALRQMLIVSSHTV